jgi:hypothetical protein
MERSASGKSIRADRLPRIALRSIRATGNREKAACESSRFFSCRRAALQEFWSQGLTDRCRSSYLCSSRRGIGVSF